MKENRVEFRTSQKEKLQFEAAAAYLGLNLSAFLRLAALERSAELMKENTPLILSDKDRDTFLRALEETMEPNENLKKAYLENL